MWRFPTVVTAEVGTASAAVALPVTIDTLPVEPFLSFASLWFNPTMTR